MAALLFFIALNSPGAKLDPGTTQAISRYGALDGQPHGALDICSTHARVLNKDAEGTHAYFCKEIPESGSKPRALPLPKGFDK